MKSWRRKGGSAAAASIVAGCALLWASCATVERSGTPELAAEPIPLSGAHPMRADSLGKVMRSFDDAVRTRVPGELDQYDRWQGVYPALADAAAELKASAITLAGHPPKGLELPDRGRFSVLGRSLAQAAAELEEAAARGDEDAVIAARSAVGAACRDCHARFRPETPGVPEAFQ